MLNINYKKTNFLIFLIFKLGLSSIFAKSTIAQVLTFDTTDTIGNDEVLEVYYNDSRLLTQVGDPAISKTFSNHNNNLRDFTLIGELNQNTGIGTILEVVVYQSGGNNGTETGNGTIQDFLDNLAAEGQNNPKFRITNTKSL